MHLGAPSKALDRGTLSLEFDSMPPWREREKERWRDGMATALYNHYRLPHLERATEMAIWRHHPETPCLDRISWGCRDRYSFAISRGRPVLERMGLGHPSSISGLLGMDFSEPCAIRTHSRCPKSEDTSRQEHSTPQVGMPSPPKCVRVSFDCFTGSSPVPAAQSATFAALSVKTHIFNRRWRQSPRDRLPYPGILLQSPPLSRSAFHIPPLPLLLL